MWRQVLLSLSLICMMGFAVAASSPEQVVLVDTGYDLCLQTKGSLCTQNHNLLFRGAEPLDQKMRHFNRVAFDASIWQAIQVFEEHHKTSAILPASAQALANYRIVMINLVNGYSALQLGREAERQELTQEFQDSGQGQGLPLQHHLYGLQTPWQFSTYAFEWWPLTLPKRGLFAPRISPDLLNWPNQLGTPPHDYLPAEYLPMDFPYLIGGQAFSAQEVERGAASIVGLLQTLPKDGHPLLIFYHCIAGEDRTGAVTMAYYLQYGGYSARIEGLQKTPRSPPLRLQAALEATMMPHLMPNSRARIVAQMYCAFLGRAKADCQYASIHWWQGLFSR